MLIVASLAATLISTPQLDQGDLLERYMALGNSDSAAAFVEVVVEPDGKVASCEALDTFGAARLAGKMCPLLKRARWEAGRDARGERVHGRVRRLITLFQPETSEGKDIAKLQQMPDVELAVSRLPDADDDELTLSLAVLLDENGQVIDCGSSSDEPEVAPYVKLACQSAGGIDFMPLTVSGGRPVSYVTNLMVRFIGEAAKP